MSEPLGVARKVKDSEGEVHVEHPPYDMHPPRMICGAVILSGGVEKTDEAVSCEGCARIILLCRHVQVVPSVARSIL